MTCRVQAGRLYDVRVVVEAEGGVARDEVTLQYGVRRLDWDGAGARINLQPLYIHGIARHEDAVTRGKVRSIFRAVSNTYCAAQGLDLVTLARDHRLLAWLGVNG